jgi:predicted Zn-dependent protease
MPDTGAVDPRLRMVECARDDNHVGALFWAKRAFQVNRLPPADRVLALEMALRVPGELDFASKLASSIALKNLENEMDQRKYLVCIGQVLAGPDRFRPNQNQFVHYRELFEQAVQKWPEEELLWCWLYLASEPERQEGILQRGLTRHPESARMRLYLGRVQYQRGARNEALITWFEAVNKGERDLRFLQAVHQLAQEEGDRHRTEVLHRLILATQPQNPQEALKLAEFALHEKRVAEALQFVEQGLSQDPHHPELRRLKAKILFEQQKYELCLELDWVKEPGNDTTLRMLRGRCLYELKRYSDAAQEMADLITKGEGTAETWYYLVRCYQCLGKHDHARQALAHALRFFPNDERLQKLARIMGI